MNRRRRWFAPALCTLVAGLLLGGCASDNGTGTPTPTTQASPSDPTAPSPSAAPSETLQQQIQRVARVMEEVRELTFEEVPEPTIMSPEALAEAVAEEVSAYTVEDADLDGRLLTLLGAIPPGTDLRELLVTAYSEQVAGYYDDDTGELVVSAPEDGQRLSPLNELILAHELEHALADQALGLPDIEDLGDGREDEVLARQALVEGDATVAMQQYAEVGLSVVDQLRVAQEAMEMQGAGGDLTALPPYLQGSIEFPYTYGAEFVATLVAQGGWAAVDAAYADPPVSTAQILFPERYVAGDQPVAPPVTGSPGSEWEAARTYGFGAADLLLLFGAPGGAVDRALPDARAAAGAWEGGEARLWVDGDRSAATLALAGAALCRPIDDWYAASFPGASRSQAEGAVVFEGEQAAVLRCGAAGVRLGIAPDVPTATAMVAG